MVSVAISAQGLVQVCCATIFEGVMLPASFEEPAFLAGDDAPPLPDAKPIVAPIAVESPEPPGAEGAGAMSQDSPKRRRLAKKGSTFTEVVGFNPKTDPRELFEFFEEFKDTTIENHEILLERMQAIFHSRIRKWKR